MESKFKTYYILVGNKYLTTVYERNDKITQTITHAKQENAAIWTFAEAIRICAQLVRQHGDADICEMEEAIDDDEYEVNDHRTEDDKKAEAAAEYADDHRDDELL
jgi:hypothetical protein